ncbi:MAG TPA: diadenylate cyclase CdaA [Candidatus Deferrimicrobiaceae bacterium]
MNVSLPAFGLVDLLDILLVAVLLYWLFLLFRGTRAVQIMAGLLVVMGMYVLSRKIGMVTFQWVVGNFLGGFIVILVIIFQSEIRRGLAKMGQARLFGGPTSGGGTDFLERVADVACRLADSRTGTILLLERETGLSEYREHGKAIDALFSYELLVALLAPPSPLHDGAVVIRGERVAAAGVILPLPADSPRTRGMGTRHRAAWGVSSETDAVAVVISEQTGNITVFYERKVQPVENAMELLETLKRRFRK